MPQRPPDLGGTTALDLLDAVPGLRLADRDWRALASMRHPVKVALWLAMLRSSEELIARESLVETTQDRHSTGPVPERSSIPAVIAWAEAAVLKGIRGDMQAWSLVADRIEGKVGHRKDDVDPEDARRRGDVQAVIEAVVVGLTNNRLNNPGDDSIDVTPELMLDTERQDSDTRSRTRNGGAAQREAEDNQGRGETLAQTNDAPEERDLSDPLEGPRIVHTPHSNGRG